MSERIDALVELTDVEIALVAGGGSNVELMTSYGAGVLVGGGGNGNFLNRDANAGYYNSHFGDGAYFYGVGA
jgi:hypothetical protein